MFLTRTFVHNRIYKDYMNIIPLFHIKSTYVYG